MSQILGQLSDYNDVLSRKTQPIKITSNDRLLSLSNMRKTEKEYQPSHSSATIKTSEKN